MRKRGTRGVKVEGGRSAGRKARADRTCLWSLGLGVFCTWPNLASRPTKRQDPLRAAREWSRRCRGARVWCPQLPAHARGLVGAKMTRGARAARSPQNTLRLSSSRAQRCRMTISSCGAWIWPAMIQWVLFLRVLSLPVFTSRYDFLPRFLCGFSRNASSPRKLGRTAPKMRTLPKSDVFGSPARHSAPTHVYSTATPHGHRL